MLGVALVEMLVAWLALLKADWMVCEMVDQWVGWLAFQLVGSWVDV